MNLESLGFPPPVVSALKAHGVNDLNPPQAATVKKGLLNGTNIVVASPTASGKTLIAEMAILKRFLANEKSVYLVPLKALASEKFDEFREKYGPLGMRVAVSTGDFDSRDERLGNYDVIILSNEKMDSLLRRNVSWVRDVRLVVADEIHLMDDTSRGPTLEVVLTKLREMTNSQVLALSATIKNASDIAEWLNAKLVESNYRPIKLSKGVMYPSEGLYRIEFDNKKIVTMSGAHEGEIAACIDTLNLGKQSIVFVGTRRSAEATAEKIGKKIEEMLTDGEKKQLSEIAEEAENALVIPTKQCRRLGRLLRCGTAFHHAGLVAKQRKIVEDSFKSGLVKFIVATPTLAFGVNLPAYRVLIRDAKRYDSGFYGSSYIPVFEVHQMMGRAGRPKYDSEGEAIILAKTGKEAEEMKEKYIFGELEPIYSKLSSEPALRMHILALVASGYAASKDKLKEFLSKTFFAKQYGDIDSVMEKTEKILDELASYGFVEYESEPFISSDFKPAFSLMSDTGLKATRIGKRVSELYIDPVSAKLIIDNIDAGSDLGYLTIINQCAEMRPTLRVKKGDELAVPKMGIKIPDVWDIEYEEFLSAFKTSLMLRDWMNETSEDKMLEKYGITPGELYNKTLNAEWMVYSARELAVILNNRNAANRLNKLRLRIKYGVKEELLDLVSLKNIGRARARLLFRNGIKSAKEIKSVKKERLEKLLGPKIAASILQEVSENREQKFQRIKSRSKQRYDN